MPQVTCSFRRGNPPAFDRAVVLIGCLQADLAELAALEFPDRCQAADYRECRVCDCRGVHIDARGMLWTLNVWEAMLAGIDRDFDGARNALRDRVEAALAANEPDHDNPDTLPLPVIVHVNGRGAEV